jgi:uncharacterized protein YbjT (DUF2867 family)
MIVVIGATGTNGTELIKQLTKMGERIKAVARDPDKAAYLKSDNVDITQGDLDHLETLESALGGAERAFVVSSVNQNYVKQIGNFIEAARSTGIKHIVKFSGMGADADSPSLILRMHAETDAMVRDSGLAYTILQPNSFFQNMLWSAHAIKTLGAFHLPLRDTRQSVVDVRDIGAVAARVLTSDDHYGQTYVITGPEALSYIDVAEKLSEVLGKKIDYVDVPPDVARDAMIKAGMSEWDATAVAEIYTAFTIGNYSEVTDVISRVTGKQPITFDQFAREYATAFQ